MAAKNFSSQNKSSSSEHDSLPPCNMHLIPCNMQKILQAYIVNTSIVQRLRFGACLHMATTSYTYMYMLEL